MVPAIAILIAISSSRGHCPSHWPCCPSPCQQSSVLSFTGIRRLSAIAKIFLCTPASSLRFWQSCPERFTGHYSLILCHSCVDLTWQSGNSSSGNSLLTCHCSQAITCLTGTFVLGGVVKAEIPRKKEVFNELFTLNVNLCYSFGLSKFYVRIIIEQSVETTATVEDCRKFAKPDLIVAVLNVDGSKCSVVLLRDSGSLQSLVKKDVLQEGQFVDVEEIRVIRCVNGIVSEISLVEVNLKSKFSDEVVLLGVAEHLPENVHFIIGNDLDSNSKIESVNVVTRLQAKKLLQVPVYQNADATSSVKKDAGNSRVVIDNDNENVNFCDGDLSNLYSDNVVPEGIDIVDTETLMKIQLWMMKLSCQMRLWLMMCLI